MKPSLILLILAALFSNGALAASSPSAAGKTIQDLNVISPRVLQRSINPKFYKSLVISPIDGWIVVGAQWVHTRLAAPRIVRSELGGAYDQLALKFASDLEITGIPPRFSNLPGGPVLLHLLVYHTADGTMLLSFPTLDMPGGNQMYYWGCSRLAVIKKDGSWVEIEGPPGLHGRGWAVCPPGKAQWKVRANGVTIAREGKRKAKLPPPPASVLQPILASNRG